MLFGELGNVTTATDMRDAYIAAEMAVLKGQSVEMAGRRLTRADLVEIRDGRKEWELRVRDEAAAALGRRGPLRYAVADFTGSDDPRCRR
jgi:hypothetical protein